MNKSTLATAIALAAALLACGSAHAAKLSLVNADPAGAGLNDNTAATPVGGNPGKSVGEQRRIVYQYAMDAWGAVLESNAEVRIGASFAALTCLPTSGTLGSAGANLLYALSDNHAYPAALADALVGFDIDPGLNDIRSQFNSQLGTPSCLTSLHWYYGLDGKTPANGVNFLNVVMHEIGHGLGAASFINKTSGAFFAGFPDHYTRWAYDNVTGKGFEDPAETPALRATAMKTPGRTVWSGGNVDSQANLILSDRIDFRALSPAAVAGTYVYATSQFGPLPSPSNFNGVLALATDAADVAGPSTTDACSAITNPAAVAGKVALVDRGTCGAAIKTKNAQNAGAIAVMIVNNVPGNPVGFTGVDPTITIPTMTVSQADGTAFKANLPVTVGFVVDSSLRQGADNAGRVRLYSPTTVAAGSTFSHYDTELSPDALMEPFDSPTVQSQVNVDLTPAMFADIGWTLNPGNGKIGTCDTSVDAVATGGIIIGANVVANSGVCAAQSKGVRGNYITCMIAYANGMKQKGLINTSQYAKVIQCAALRR